jgi:putative transposase
MDTLLLRGECGEHLSATSSPSAGIRWTVTRKAFKYRLYPTRPQARNLERTLALCYGPAGAQGGLPQGVGYYERVDQAFQGFFRRVREGEKPG